MQQKFIAIGVAVVVVLAAVGGGVALVANSNHDDNNNKTQTTDFSGKWNLSYMEMANLMTKEGGAIQKADDVKIFNRFLNPDDGMMTLNITSVGTHGFRGVLSHDVPGYQTDKNIHGTINGPVIKFTIFNEKLSTVAVYEAICKGDYLTTSVVIHKVPTSTDEKKDHPIVCGASYMLFIRDGSTPVHPRVDYVDMGVMKAAEQIKGTVHMVTDFTKENGTGRGSDMPGTSVYSHAGNMITVFDNKAPKPGAEEYESVGVMAVVSTGVTPNGTASGRIAGNINSTPINPNHNNSTVSGHMYMAHGKATFLMHMHNEDMEEGPGFVEAEFNVPYYKGGEFTPVYISETHPYTGTVTIRTSADKNPETHDVKRYFEVYDNTFYSSLTVDGQKIIWFGEIYGHRVDMYVLNQSPDGSFVEAGRFTGHVEDNGRIHLFGMMHSSDGNNTAFIEYDIGVSKS